MKFPNISKIICLNPTGYFFWGQVTSNNTNSPQRSRSYITIIWLLIPVTEKAEAISSLIYCISIHSTHHSPRSAAIILPHTEFCSRKEIEIVSILYRNSNKLTQTYSTSIRQIVLSVFPSETTFRGNLHMFCICRRYLEGSVVQLPILPQSGNPSD